MLEQIKTALQEAFPEDAFTLDLDERNILTIRGECDNWRRVVDIGHYAAKQPGVRNVVNEMGVKGMEIPKKDYTPYRERGLKKGVVDTVDVLIIGAGISGCGVARELSKYKLDILVVDKGEDVCTAASKANNGDIHPGHAVKPGTLKAELNVKGNRMYTRWAEELGFELDRCGAVGAVDCAELLDGVKQVYDIAVMNGVDGVEMVDGKRAKELEPGFERHGLEPYAAVYLPSFGLVEPYKVAVALAENAIENGVRFWLNCTVGDILVEDGTVKGAVTSKGIVHAKYVINAAGVYADEISAMAGDKCYTIHPRKGTLAVLDKSLEPRYEGMSTFTRLGDVKRAQKDPESKGGGMCRTPERNILMGPSATEVPDKEDISSTPEGLAYAMVLAEFPEVNYGQIIRFFTGTRPADYKEDFLIEMSEITDGFINVGGIQSPGLAAAPAVAERVENILKEAAEKRGEPLKKDPEYNPIRKQEVEFRHLSREEQDEVIRKDPRYGKIVCRCETITEGEILDAIHSPLVPTSIDAIKRRTRAGMGRCQGGFCQPRVLEILARELGQDWIDINLKGTGTNVLVDNNRKKEAGNQ